MAGKVLGCAMIVTRFAPSPTGYLHLGHAFAALTAARAGERFLLRIEDLDRERAREEFVTAILEDLAWLGLTWEEPWLRQSKRFDAYGAALERLSAPSPIPVSAPARRSPKKSRARSKRRMRWGRTVRCIPAPAAACRPPNGGAIARGAPYALRLDAAKAAEAVGP